MTWGWHGPAQRGLSSFASHLVMKGVSIYKVSQWLGHRSVNTTMICAHLAPQDDEINKL